MAGIEDLLDTEFISKWTKTHQEPAKLLQLQQHESNY